MPTRMIREGILTSERVNQLSERAELFYRRLMSVVDDYGRFSANATLLRATCYPLKLDSVKEDSIKKHLAEAADAGLVVLYTVEGKPYLQLADFGQRIQSKSKYPEPPSGPREFTVIHGGPPDKTALVGDGVEDEVGVAGGSPTARATVIELPLNDGSVYAVTQAQVDEFAALYPAVDVTTQLRAMKGWCIANPAKRKTRGGLLKFVNAWLAKEQDKGGAARPAPPVAAGKRREQL